MEQLNQVTLAGKAYPIAFPMAVVDLYQKTSAEIERRRSLPADPDPACYCGRRKSEHTGPDLVIGGGDQPLQCAGFELDDPRAGDNLFRVRSLANANPARDPERFIALLWCAMHTFDDDKDAFVPPFSLQKAGALVQPEDVSAIYEQLVTAMVSAMPRRKASPNGAAPVAPAQTSEPQTLQDSPYPN